VEHAAKAAEGSGLRRHDLVALVINSVVGAGIFGLPSRVFALAGTYSLLAYVVAAAAIFLVILCFAEVASRFTSTGGPYLYARTTFGPVVGFQTGWLLWLARIAGFASLANLFVGYLAQFMPAVSGEPWRSVTMVAVVSAVTAVNIVGVRVTTAVTNALTVGKLVPLLLLIGIGLFAVDPGRYSVATPPSSAAFSQATLLLIFTFIGFEGVTIPTGEMRDPARHLPFALFSGLAIVALVYIFVQVVCIGTLPDLAQSSRPLADAGLRVLGPSGASVIAVGALLSIAGTLNAAMFANPRLLLAMAEQRQLPQVLSATHARFRTPVAATVLTSMVSLGLALFSSFVSALTISTVVRLLVYATTCAALPVLRWNSSARRAPFSAPAGPFLSIVSVVLSAWLVSSAPWGEMRMAGFAVLSGFLLYLPCAWWSRDTRPAISPGVP
jgi:amino acid transporter